MDDRSYGIPCAPLMTAEVPSGDTPSAIDGPVFISAAVPSGFETGTGPLNPYEQFQREKPAAIIDYGVFVYAGHFEIPLAAALNHVHKARVLLGAGKAPSALSEAQQAEALAPDSAVVNSMLGEALDASGQTSDATRYYQKALTIAKSMQPEFQAAMIADLEKRLGTRKAGVLNCSATHCGRLHPGEQENDPQAPRSETRPKSSAGLRTVSQET